VCLLATRKAKALKLHVIVPFYELIVAWIPCNTTTMITHNLLWSTIRISVFRFTKPMLPPRHTLCRRRHTFLFLLSCTSLCSYLLPYFIF
jgi:hypothetical protein